MKKLFTAALALALALALTACGGGTTSSTGSAAQSGDTSAGSAAQSGDTSAADSAQQEHSATAQVDTTEAQAPEGGFEEIEIWADEEVGFLNVNGVYFQPVPMSGGFENYEDYNLHFEADVSALENNLGYGVGDWVPYMQVDYELTGKNSGTVVSGTFMPMNADDGNHYGNNLKMDVADTYSVKLTFHSPAESGFLIHLDDETGPGGSLDDYQWPLVLELPDVWDYAPTEW